MAEVIAWDASEECGRRILCTDCYQHLGFAGDGEDFDDLPLDSVAPGTVCAHCGHTI